MLDLKKIVDGKHLTPGEMEILRYIVDHVEGLLEKGVRQIARETFTSPSSIMRLSKKLGYGGFVDMVYQLQPLVKGEESRRGDSGGQALEGPLASILALNGKKSMETFRALLKSPGKYVFLYATGFSGICAEYFSKKLLVKGHKVIYASGSDSIAILESNLEEISMFVTVTKSGETRSVIEKMAVCKEKGIPVVTFTQEMDCSASRMADITFRVRDPQKLDDRNMAFNLFFAETIMLMEYLLTSSSEKED